MARRGSAKAARKKDLKRQRAAEKRLERQRARALSPSDVTPSAAAKRLQMLRDAVAKGEPPAPRGLVNLGNTCFFNAVMQCLTRVAHFRQHFVFKPAAPGEGPMTTALRAFLVEQWKVGDSSVFNPSQLFAEVGKKNPSFKGRAQQDAHELMKVVFDAVVDEEKARLTKVFRGHLPPLASDPQENDTQSENSHSTSASSVDIDNSLVDDHSSIPQPDSESTDHHSPTSVVQSPSEAGSASTDADHLAPASTAESEQQDTDQTKQPAEPADDSSDEQPIPPEKLHTIIERAVGGVLSSTIVCKECGTKSAVYEPFLDLQVPLVPKDESEAKAAKVVETAKSKESRAEKASKKEVEVEQEKDQAEEAQQIAPSTVVIAAGAPPAPPPPPPPLPPLALVRPSASSANSNCDVMKELRENVPVDTHVEGPAPDASPVVEERQLVVYGPQLPDSGLHSGEDAKAVFEDDDDVEGYGCLSSLFDTDFGDEDDNDTAVDDVKDMTAFSTSDAAYGSSSSATASAAKPQSNPTSAGPRRTPAFISSLFGGFGGISPAPHGYRSIVGSLEEFTKVEVLEGDNSYGCEECTRREKLRIAMQRYNTKSISAKKIEASAEILSDDPAGDSDFGGAEEAQSEKGVADGGDGTSSAETSDDIPDPRGASRTRRQVIMSTSPVTSSGSESSSGVTSEDDGELVIEEELEHPSVSKPERRRGMTREEEDALLKSLDIKVPTVRTTAEKRFVVRKAPDVLAVQLKRFAQVGYRGGLRKISGHVDFPLELDFAPFVEEDTASESAENTGARPTAAKRRRSGDSCLDGTSKVKACKYSLTGVTVHGGSLSGGHYTAYVRERVDSNRRGGWYFCNDSKIQRASERDVLNSEAYLLYYERIAV